MNAKNELVDKLLEIFGIDYCTIRDVINFINNLDFEYNNGFGSQELFGTVWFNDNTWLERKEYDGSEWWIHCKRPQIPEELR